MVVNNMVGEQWHTSTKQLQKASLHLIPMAGHLLIPGTGTCYVRGWLLSGPDHAWYGNPRVHDPVGHQLDTTHT